MGPIYHLALRSAWDRAPDEGYRTGSLDSEGFIHCCRADQVAWAANRFHARSEGLVVLTIDPGQLFSPVKFEPGGGGDLFPHVYGPIDRGAVVAVTEMTRGPDGLWAFPAAG